MWESLFLYLSPKGEDNNVFRSTVQHNLQQFFLIKIYLALFFHRRNYSLSDFHGNYDHTVGRTRNVVCLFLSLMTAGTLCSWTDRRCVTCYHIVLFYRLKTQFKNRFFKPYTMCSCVLAQDLENLLLLLQKLYDVIIKVKWK